MDDNARATSEHGSDADELENAVYDYVMTSRDHGDMHVKKRTGRLV